MIQKASCWVGSDNGLGLYSFNIIFWRVWLDEDLRLLFGYFLLDLLFLSLFKLTLFLWVIFLFLRFIPAFRILIPSPLPDWRDYCVTRLRRQVVVTSVQWTSPWDGTLGQNLNKYKGNAHDIGLFSEYIIVMTCYAFKALEFEMSFNLKSTNIKMSTYLTSSWLWLPCSLVCLASELYSLSLRVPRE